MKKQIAVLLAAVLAPTLFAGCAKQATEPPQERPVIDMTHGIDDNIKGGIEITVEDVPTAPSRICPAFPGVRRRFEADMSGTYTVEYIHTPYGIDRDDTLDYRLDLSADNTYSMTVTADGVTVDHSGKWYSSCGTITLFFDEPIEQPPHNTYVADSMYCEIISQGKLMVYDRGYTVVLSK